MSREAHVRFDGSGEGQFLPATLLKGRCGGAIEFRGQPECSRRCHAPRWSDLVSNQRFHVRWGGLASTPSPPTFAGARPPSLSNSLPDARSPERLGDWPVRLQA